LRPGKEFSSFDLAIGSAIEPAEFFDVEICLAHHLEEHDEPAAIVDVADLVDTPFWINTPATRPLTPSTTDPLKAGSKRRKREKRAKRAAAVAAGATAPKSVSVKHLQSCLQNAVSVDVDTAQLPHSKPAWIGLRSAEDESANGMGGRAYTRDEIQALTGRGDLRYINWLGR
jgi:hypothetical protein